MKKLVAQNENQKNLLNLFDYELFKKNPEVYTTIIERTTITDNSDVDFIIDLLKELPEKEKYSDEFSPVLLVLAQTFSPLISASCLNYYTSRIIPFLESSLIELEPYLRSDFIIAFLLFAKTDASLNLLITYLVEINDKANEYSLYCEIKDSFAIVDDSVIDFFVQNADKLLHQKTLQTIAFIELFSNWAKDGKFNSSIIEKNLDIFESFIFDIEKISYAMSCCYALTYIDTPRSQEILKKAINHKKLEIQLQAACSLILLGVDDGFIKINYLAENPIIAQKAVDNMKLLKREYNVDCYRKVDMSGFPEREFEDFCAIMALSNWCQSEHEYGQTPDFMQVWKKEEIYWPPSGKMQKVFLIKYRYENFRYYNGLTEDIENIGYFNPDNNSAFSFRENSPNESDKYELYAKYAAFEVEWGIAPQSPKMSKDEMLNLIKSNL